MKPKRTSVEIVSSFSGTINTGKYENEKPMFSIKETWTNISEDEISRRQKAIEAMCYERFSEVEQRSLAEKILQQRSDLRIYEHNGKKYPSVTSIIGWDADMFVSPAELLQYGARGTCLHKQVEVFLKTKTWIPIKDIPEVYPEYVCVKKGDLGLKLDDVDFQGFYAANPFEVVELEQRVINEEYRYAGRCDIVAIVDGKRTVVDIKTGSTVDQEKAFKQTSAYAKALSGIEQLMVIHLNAKTKQGWSKPIITTEIEKHFQMFLKDRESFKMRFGL